MSKHLKVSSHCISSIFLYYNLYLRSGDVFDGRPWQLKRSSCLLSACCSVARQSWEGVRGRKFNSDWKYSFFLVCWTDWDYISVCLENSYFPGNKLWKEASNLLQWNWKMRIIDEKERKSKESWCNRCRGSEILIFNARTWSWTGIWGNMSSWQKLRRGGELRVEGDWDCMRGNTRASESEGGWWRRVQKKEKRLRVWEAVERRWRLREGGVSLRANRVAGGDRKYLPEVNTKLRIETGPTIQWVGNPNLGIQWGLSVNLGSFLHQRSNIVLCNNLLLHLNLVESLLWSRVREACKTNFR